MNNQHLVIGGPFDGQRRPWSGDEVEYPGDVRYYKILVHTEDADPLIIYAHSSLSKQEALQQLVTHYLNI